MKRKICIAVAALCLAFSGCSYLDVNLPSTDSEVLESSESGDSTGEVSSSPENETTPAHEHRYTIEVSRRAATCTDDEKILLRCSCGESKIETGAPALGHAYGEIDSSSRILPCTREGCTSVLLPGATENKKRECTFTEQTKQEMEDDYAALLRMIEEAGVYLQGQHGYDESSPLFEKNKTFKAAYKAYEEKIYDLGAQYQYGQIAYHIDMQNEQVAKTYNDVRQYYNTAVGYYYGLYQKIYDSALRNYFFHGQSNESIEDTLAEYGSRGNEEILALENANVELEMQFYSLADPAQGSEVLDIYAEFVANNKRIAALSGYPDYMTYAYEKDYGREYTPAQVEVFYQYVKEYLSPLYPAYEQKYSQLFSAGLPTAEAEEFNAISGGSFFKNLRSNQAVNDFMVNVSIDKGDSTLSYAEKLEALMSNGDYYLGEYQGAYAWRIQKEGVPILYFGPNYQEAFTVVHEFGHYMNYLYNGSRGGSFDLMETHSQGLEMLFLSFLSGDMQARAYNVMKTNELRGSLRTILLSTSVNAFEQAVYTDSYDGVNSEQIMADNTITKDEYDLLFQSIQQDLGFREYKRDSYWRHVVIGSPAYYISYAVSMASSLQFLVCAEESGLNAAAQKYLQTVIYTDEHPTWNYKEVLTGAGLYAYDDEQLFISLQEYLRLD